MRPTMSVSLPREKEILTYQQWKYTFTHRPCCQGGPPSRGMAASWGTLIADPAKFVQTGWKPTDTHAGLAELLRATHTESEAPCRKA
jgi:hypothetical protein